MKKKTYVIIALIIAIAGFAWYCIDNVVEPPKKHSASSHMNAVSQETVPVVMPIVPEG